VIERKIRLDGTVSDYECEALLIEKGKRAVLRYVLPHDLEFPTAAFGAPKGTVTIGHYWTDRPYNVYQWMTPRGIVLGWYFNVVDATVVDEELVSYEDLAVDVLVDPTGRTTVLDEDELPTDLEPKRRGIVSRALEALTSSPMRLAREIEAETRRFL
jgi:hypothetical protein